MSNPPAGAAPETTLHRFGRIERAVHWTIAVLMTSCILTAAVLYNGSLSVRVGHRHLVELVHVYSGFALPVPMLLGLTSVAYRVDLHRLGRFTPSDWQWLRSRQRRDGTIRVGKFNAGQKLNASVTVGSILVLLGSGIIMYFPNLTRLSWRTGATFVHDWFALGLGLLIVGHISYAIRDRESRRGMRTGRVSATWARAEHVAWVDEIQAGPAEIENTKQP
ncbi:MAG: hypothetical protein QOJ11_2797 [Frankiales bacterium]|jgi:formate dehydrogenase subunit gamma|nr:hypothetical protein [Frankiales bacterium]